MSKFVKLAAEPRLFSFEWWSKNALGLFGKNKAVREMMKAKGVRNVTNASFFSEFFKLLQDNDFQDVVFSLLISMPGLDGKPLLKDANGNSLDIKPEEMFKDLNYYFKTQGSQLSGKPSGSIAAGAYQSILFPQPRKEILPKDNVIENTISRLKSLTSSPDFNKKTPDQKRQILLNFTKQILGENGPLASFIDSNKILP
jgi:hypothetical protein